MRPKILFVTDLPLWSMREATGGPAFSQTLKKYMDENWEVFILSSDPRNQEYTGLDAEHNVVVRCPSFMERNIHLKKIGLIFRYLNHQWATKAFCRHVREMVGDHREHTLLYAYEIFGVKACSILARELNVPMVTRFQGTILSQFKPCLANRIKRYPHYQALSEKADLVIMTDDGTQGDQVLRQLHNKSDQILFLRNGLELMEKDVPKMVAAFDRAAFRSKLGIGADDTMFLTVSRLTGWKRVDRAIDGFADCNKKNPHTKLVIVGDGDSREALEKQAEALGVRDHVIFAGAVQHDAVYQYMMACDIFVSLYDLSNVGNPLLEAMTLGKCVVTLDVGDTNKLICNRQNGIILTYTMLPLLGDIFSELIENKALRDRLGSHAREYALANFCSWKERMDKEYMSVSKLII